MWVLIATTHTVVWRYGSGISQPIANNVKSILGRSLSPPAVRGENRADGQEV